MGKIKTIKYMLCVYNNFSIFFFFDECMCTISCNEFSPFLCCANLRSVYHIVSAEAQHKNKKSYPEISTPTTLLTQPQTTTSHLVYLITLIHLSLTAFC